MEELLRLAFVLRCPINSMLDDPVCAVAKCNLIAITRSTRWILVDPRKSWRYSSRYGTWDVNSECETSQPYVPSSISVWRVLYWSGVTQRFYEPLSSSFFHCLCTRYTNTYTGDKHDRNCREFASIMSCMKFSMSMELLSRNIYVTATRKKNWLFERRNTGKKTCYH